MLTADSVGMRWTRRLSDDGGFSLIETAVGLTVATIAAVLFVGAMTSNQRLGAANRFHQQATAIAVADIEAARNLSWSALALSSFNSAAPLLEGTSQVLSASETGIPFNENLVVSGSGGLAPSQVTVIDGTSLQAWRYVTTSSYAADLRRVVVQVVWSVAGASHSVVFSTLISQTGAA